MAKGSTDGKQVRPRLTIEHFVYATDRQVGILCGYSKGNGHHLNYSQPKLERIQSLAKWYGGDLAAAISAIEKRQKHWRKLQRMSKLNRANYETEIAEQRKVLCEEVDAAIELERSNCA